MRKAMTMANAEAFSNAGDAIGVANAVSGKVQSLAYFVDAVNEAVSDPHCDQGYKQYLQHALSRALTWNRKKDPKRETA